MKKKINTEGLTQLLEKAKNEPQVKPSARRYIIDNYSDIEAAKAKGVTYAAMAHELGISANSFSIALAKAREEIAGAETQDKQTIKKVPKAPPVKNITSNKFETTNL